MPSITVSEQPATSESLLYPTIYDGSDPPSGSLAIIYSVFTPPPYIKPVAHFVASEGPDTKKRFDNIVAEAALGITSEETGPELSKIGSSGSYFLKNTQGHTLGIFKPQDEEPYGPLSPKMTKWIHRNFFPCLFGRSCLVPNCAYIAEAAASLIDRQLQCFIVPYTDIVSFSSKRFYYPPLERFQDWVSGSPLREKRGSFQLFLDGFVGADDFFKEYPLPDDAPNCGAPQPNVHPLPLRTTAGHPLWTKQMLLNFQRELEKLVILDVIIRNTDRGLDNWMLKLGGDSDSPTIELRAIDNGLAFPWKHPDEWRSFPYGWLYLPLSIIGKPFLEETRLHYLPLLTSTSWWEDTVRKLRTLSLESHNSRMSEKQLQVLKGQAWSIVETLKAPGEGPLDLVRKARVLVEDQTVSLHPKSSQTSATQTTTQTNSAQTSSPTTSATSPTIRCPAQPTETPATNSSLATDENQSLWYQLVSGDIDEVNYERRNSVIRRSYGSITEATTTRKGIIEKLQVAEGRPPVFNCC